MKKFTTLLLFLALALIIFNSTHINFTTPLEGESMYALIGIITSFCAILIILIFRISKKIEKKTQN